MKITLQNSVPSTFSKKAKSVYTLCRSTSCKYPCFGRIKQECSSKNIISSSLSTKFSTMAVSKPDLLFRQLFERESCSYTYLLACNKTKEAILIDPVLETVDRDVEQINCLGLTLKYGVNTHCHADHVTGTAELRKRFPLMKSVISEMSKAKADIHIREGDLVQFGEQALEVLSTPGHTNGCVTYSLRGHDILFTGDALLIRGCGRTDFQEGNPRVLYESVKTKILSLPDHTYLYPAHDYKGRTVTTVGEENKFNPRLTKSKEEFVGIMDTLGLPYPQKIDFALPANLKCGVYE